MNLLGTFAAALTPTVDLDPPLILIDSVSHPGQPRRGPHQLFGYTGSITDPMDGLLHLGHRWYGSHNGRFTQRDDISTVAGPNTYQCVASNPINYGRPHRTVGTRQDLAGIGIAAGALLSVTAAPATAPAALEAAGAILGGGSTGGFIVSGIGNACLEIANDFLPTCRSIDRGMIGVDIGLLAAMNGSRYAGMVLIAGGVVRVCLRIFARLRYTNRAGKD